MKGKNRVIIRGNLTDKPKIRYTKTKEPVAWFIVAANYPIRSADGSGWEQGTDFIPVLCFRKAAALAEKYLDKGSAVECEGKLKNRERDDNGKRLYELIFIASDITLLGKFKSASMQSAETPSAADSIEEYPDDGSTVEISEYDYLYSADEILKSIGAKNPATYQ